MGIGRADEAKLKGIDSGVGFEGEPVLEHIARHVAAPEFFEWNGLGVVSSNFAHHRSEHAEVVRFRLLEVAQLVFGKQSASSDPVVAAFRRGLMLGQLDDGLEK